MSGKVNHILRLSANEKFGILSRLKHAKRKQMGFFYESSKLDGLSVCDISNKGKPLLYITQNIKSDSENC